MSNLTEVARSQSLQNKFRPIKYNRPILCRDPARCRFFVSARVVGSAGSRRGDGRGGMSAQGRFAHNGRPRKPGTIASKERVRQSRFVHLTR